MRNRSRLVRALTLVLAAPAVLGATPLPEPGDVSVTVTGLRSARGRVLACLTAKPKAFPDCEKDSAARSISVPAGKTVAFDFGEVPAGRYAISLFHDENDNGKLDTRLLMPREGYGFSRNAPVRLGPPSFASAAFTVDGDDAHEAIRMRYMF